MPVGEPLPSRKPGLVAIDAHAADNLRFIRETMESAARFTALPGWGGVVIGATAVAATVVAARQATPQDWLFTWLVEAALAVAIAAGATLRKAAAAGLPLLHGPARKFALSFAPPLLVGALLTPVLAGAGLYHFLPGVWLLLYGTAVVTGGAFSVRVVPLMGLCFMAVGIVGLFLPAGWGNWLMGAGFGGLQIVFGLIIAGKYGG